MYLAVIKCIVLISYEKSSYGTVFPLVHVSGESAKQKVQAEKKFLEKLHSSGSNEKEGREKKDEKVKVELKKLTEEEAAEKEKKGKAKEPLKVTGVAPKIIKIATWNLKNVTVNTEHRRFTRVASTIAR